MPNLTNRIQLQYDGNVLTQVQFEWGRENRPLWKTLENLPLKAAIKWCDRFSPFEAVAAEWAFALCVEDMFSLKVPERAVQLRSVYSEIQRLLWAYNYCSMIFRALKDEIRVQQFLRLREAVLEGQETLMGARVLPQILCIGGIERDLSIGEKKKLKTLVRQLEYEMRLYFRTLPMDQFVMERLYGLLVIPRERALRIPLLGVLGQASGLESDLRRDLPYGAYPHGDLVPFKPEDTVDWFEQSVFLVEGDALGRLRSVFYQIRQSLILIEKILDHLKDGEVRLELGELPRIEDGLYVRGVEGGSGPLYCLIEHGRIRLSSHSMRMVDSVNSLLKGARSDDLELAVASLGIDFMQADLCEGSI